MGPPIDFLRESRLPRALLKALLCFVILAAVLSAGGTIYAQKYTDRIYPGVHIGPVDVGALTHEEAAALLSTRTNELLEDGLTISVDDQSARLPLLLQAVDDPDATISLVRWDVDAAVREATAIGRGDFILSNMFVPLLVRFTAPQVPFNAQVDEERLTEGMLEAFAAYEESPVNAGFSIRKTAYGFDMDVTESKDGTLIDTETVLEEFETLLRERLTILPLQTQTYEVTADVTLQEATALTPRIQAALTFAPYTLVHPTDSTHTWEVTADHLLNAFEANKTETGVDLRLTDLAIAALFDPIRAEVNSPAQDARFVMENGKVTEFQGNKSGVSMNTEATVEALLSQMGKADQTIALVIDEVQPTVTVGSVNELGITERLGVGTSNFSGSPTNRIRNIKNGAQLLNGILIAPDETFSLLQALRPFTTDNGYHAELVIKGDRIEPEIGGGLCQIGTTTFRAAMNAGLPIVERQNHSLVVRYYNDPQNGNPGTDATIYDPNPDFKFLNDTGHYILFETALDETAGTLEFTFWGTPDGRKGSYSAPEVSSWIGAGERQTIETTDIPVGTEQCQHAFPGANASFTYTVINPDGSVHEQIFTSSYRPLPEICLVGVAATEESEPPLDMGSGL